MISSLATTTDESRCLLFCVRSHQTGNCGTTSIIYVEQINFCALVFLSKSTVLKLQVLSLVSSPVSQRIIFPVPGTFLGAYWGRAMLQSASAELNI